MASNISSTCHGNHVDIRYNYFNEYVEDGVVKMIFVQSADHDSNILTKNLNDGFMKGIQRSWWVRTLEMFLTLKMFDYQKTQHFQLNLQ